MTPLPGPLGGTEFVAWRLDQTVHAASWDSGEGALRSGGRWNSKGVRAVYCSIDPATAILEVALHKGFKALDIVPHTLTSLIVADPSDIHIVTAGAVANANWFRPGLLSRGQQEFGDDLLTRRKFILIPSVVSTHSWNLIFVKSNVGGAFTIASQEPFALDTRLHPSISP